MPIQSLGYGLLFVAMAGAPQAEANAEVAANRLVTFISQDSTISVQSEQVLLSKWLFIFMAFWGVLATIVAIYLAIKFFMNYHMESYAVSGMGLTVITLPALTVVAENYGFIKMDGGLTMPSAVTACTSMVCLVFMYIHRRKLPVQGANPDGVGDATRPARVSGDLQQMITEKLVEDGFPNAETVVKYLIDEIGPIKGEEKIGDLRAELREQVFNNIVSGHDISSVKASICDAVPSPRKVPYYRSQVDRVVNLCLKSSKSKLDVFIRKLDNLRS